MSQAIRALIIDDHAVVRDGIMRALEIRSGFEIFSAASKAEAIAQISRINPTLIFVDINLSDGNGLEIVAWLRKISKETAIVVLSLHDEDE